MKVSKPTKTHRPKSPSRAEHPKKSAATGLARNDKFDTRPRRNEKPLGVMPAASKESDAAYVKGLYKELLGREPDEGGFAAHLKGLETGMSREAIRDVFLTSPEFRAKQAGATTPATSGGGIPATPGAAPPPVLNDVKPTTVLVNEGDKFNTPPAKYEDQVKAAIAAVQAKGVGLDPSDSKKITNPDEYHAAVVQELRNRGLSVYHDGEELRVKRPGDNFSEQYDISTWQGDVWNKYMSYLSPPNFD